jgi:hypothetical protein
MTLFRHSRSIFETPFTGTLLVCLLTVFVAACGKPFNVKPKPDVKSSSGPVTSQAQTTLKAEGESNGLMIYAEAITDEDYLYDTFAANLLMADVLPVRLKLTNTTAETAGLRGAKLEITSQNKKYKLLDSHKTFKRLMSYYGISVYNKRGFKQSREDFDTHAFDLKKPLAAGESREGLIYFGVPNAMIKSGNLTLTARKLSAGRTKDDKQVIELNLK